MKYLITICLLLSFVASESSAQTAKKTVAKKKHATSAITQQPEFPGGVQELMKYLAKHTKYPDAAKESNVEGRVIIRFVVDKDGSISEPKLLRGIGSGCDEEAMRVVKAMPKWLPGLYKGKPVKGVYILPITFRLE